MFAGVKDCVYGAQDRSILARCGIDDDSNAH